MSKGTVLVVGVDLTDVSEPLLATARQILRDGGEGELHVVHVVPREPFTQRTTNPRSRDPGEIAGMEAAQWELGQLCAPLADGAKVKVETHTPIGDPAHEVVRVAREVGASLVLVETHDDKDSSTCRSLPKSSPLRLARCLRCAREGTRPYTDRRPQLSDLARP